MSSRILVVDDDESVREGLRYLLASEGYTVTMAGNGRDAVSAFQKTPSDLLIVDVGMPGRNGWGTLADLRGISPETPVLLITARPYQKRVAMAAGVELMDKPLDPAEFLECIERMLELRRGVRVD